MTSTNQGTNEMPRPVDPKTMQRIREEQDRLLEGTVPPPNKKKFRAEIEAQRKADLSFRIANSGLYERFSARLESWTLDLKVEPSRRNADQKSQKFESSHSAQARAISTKETEERYQVVGVQLSELLAVLSRFTLIEMNSGTQASAAADDGVGRSAEHQREPSNFFTWKQDDMQLTLSCLPKKPYAVMLHIDDGPDIELSTLCWIDKDSLGTDPDEFVERKKFPLKRIDERTYRVSMPVGIFTGRMGLLNTARGRASEKGIDPRLLLPFVS